MDYDYNRSAFRSVIKAAGIHPLAVAYCSCVLLELSIKQHLALCSSADNGGHNLPALLQRIGLRHARYLAVCNALQRQLADSLRILCSQGRKGTPRTVPSGSFPHIRYLRHQSDWELPRSPDGDVAALNAILQRIISFLTSSIGVNV
jgi:hypothetical protein